MQALLNISRVVMWEQISLKAKKPALGVTFSQPVFILCGQLTAFLHVKVRMDVFIFLFCFMVIDDIIPLFELMWFHV